MKMYNIGDYLYYWDNTHNFGDGRGDVPAISQYKIVNKTGWQIRTLRFKEHLESEENSEYSYLIVPVSVYDMTAGYIYTDKEADDAMEEVGGIDFEDEFATTAEEALELFKEWHEEND
jgi:hypothetical protein